MRPLEHPDVRSGLHAPVMEVFSSIQGEGTHVGEPQVLVRLAGCPFRCRWCDTPASWRVGREVRTRIDAPSERGGRRTEDGWSSPFRVATWVAELDPEGRRNVSVTGGEPLLWPGFVRELETFLGERRIHLETAGGLPDALERVLPAVDHVSLDLKLPADLDAPVAVAEAPGTEALPADAAAWAAARVRNLLSVRDRDACLKIVVPGGRAAGDFAELLDDAATYAPRVPLVLTPATPFGPVTAPPIGLVEELVGLALERDLDVRVVPQIHRWLGLP